MSNVSAKTTAPQRAFTKGTNPSDKRLSAKLNKGQTTEEDTVAMTDTAAQSADVVVSTTGSTSAMGDVPLMLAQADTAATSVVNTSVTTAAPVPATASSFSSLLSSGWAMGAAAVGATAVVAHNAAASAAATTTANAVANGGIVAGPVLANNDLVVHLYAADGTTQIGTATVNSAGQYTANLGNYTGVVIAKVSSTGSQLDYFDEATQSAVDLGAHVLTAVGVASATGLTLSINPLTTIAAQIAGVAADGSVSAAITASAVESANTTVATAFGITGSLIAPTALTAIVDATGSANVHADAYGKVLAVLSGLDQINGGDLQAAIQAFATDLSSNNGQLSATSKFNLMVAAQDADLTNAASGLASTIGTLAQIDASDIHEVITSGRSNFSNDDLASVLSIVLNTNVHVADIDAVIESITASAGNDLTSLTQAAGRYVALSSGSVLTAAESQGVVTLSVHGLDIVAGDTVTVTINDPTYASHWQSYTPSVLTLQVASDGQSVELPSREFWNDLWGEGQVTVTVTTASEQSVATTINTDLLAPSEFNHNSQGVSYSLNPIETAGPGYTNIGASITIPYDWNFADHWEYRIGDGPWTQGTTFVDGEATYLQLPEGTYGTLDSNKIHLRTYDDAGNVSVTVVSGSQFIVDTTAPTMTVAQDGQVAMNETGVVALIDDTVLDPTQSNLASVISVIQGSAQGHSLYANANAGEALSFATDTLSYGSYHYYALDYAGNLITGPALTLANQAPTINPQALLENQTISAGTSLNYWVPSDLFIDKETIELTATLSDGTQLPTWLTFDPLSGSLTGTPQLLDAGPLVIKLIATDSLDNTLSHSTQFTLTVVDAHQDYAVAFTNDAWTATVTDANGNTVAQNDISGNVDLSGYFSGGSSRTDTATITLDNSAGSVNPSLSLSSFAHIDINVSSNTTLGFLQYDEWRNYDISTQLIDITAAADLTLGSTVLDYRNPATVNVSGSGNVDLGQVEGPQSMTLDAHALSGSLTAELIGLSGYLNATVMGGSLSDHLSVNSSGSYMLTGGNGNDSFLIGVNATAAHVTVRDFTQGSDLLDFSAIFNMQGSEFGAVSDTALNLQNPFESGGASVNALGFQNGSDFDIYLDVDQDAMYTSNDVMVTLQNFTLGSTSMNALVTHIV